MSTDRFVGLHLDRREFLTVGMGVFVALSFPRALRRHVSLVKRSVPLMGTIAEIQVAHRDERFAENAIDAAIAELQSVERTMTRFRSDSDIGRANLGAGRDGVRVTRETAFVIAAALRASSVSDGRFDPAVGAASELWDVLNRHEPPAGDRVQRLAARRHDIEGRGRAEVHHDARPSQPIVGRDRVDDAVGADLLGEVGQDADPGAHPGLDDGAWRGRPVPVEHVAPCGQDGGHGARPVVRSRPQGRAVRTDLARATAMSALLPTMTPASSGSIAR